MHLVVLCLVNLREESIGLSVELAFLYFGEIPLSRFVLFFLVMCMWVGLCVSKRMPLLVAEEAKGYGFLGARVTGGCEAPSVGDGN